MINLINAKEFYNGEKAEEFWDFIHDKLYDVLERGFENKELIYTGDIRGIGKSITLCKLAAKHGAILIEPSNTMADMIENNFKKMGKYCSIMSEQYAIESQWNTSTRKIIVDEGVDCDKLAKNGITVITGFTNNKNNKKENTSFKEETIDDLKQELLILKQKKQRALDSNNNSDYKLLINNYKQVLELILELEKPKTVSQTWTVESNNKNFVDGLINNSLDNVEYKSNGLRVYPHYHNKDNTDNIVEEVINKMREELKKAGININSI